MRYLDYDAFRAFLSRRCGSEAERRARSVGVDRAHDSGYRDIRRFFGPEAVDPGRVALAYRETPFRLDDPLAASFARRIETQLRAEGRLHRGPMIAAVAEEHFDSPSPRLVLQPCDYGLFAGACFALDLPNSVFSPAGGTLREYHHARGLRLPAGLGVCGLLVTEEPDRTRRVLVVRRAAHLASLTGSVGPSAAGSVDYGVKWKTLEEMARAAMAAEIAEELGLTPAEYAITLLAYAGELFRGGKPQLFCRIDTSLSAATVADRLDAVVAHLARDGRLAEHTDFEFLPLDGAARLSDTDVARLNHEAAMNWRLAEESAASTSPGR